MPSTPFYRRPAFLASAAYALVWLAIILEPMTLDRLSPLVRMLGLLPGVVICGIWLQSARRRPGLEFVIAASVAYLPCWAWLVFLADWLAWPGLGASLLEVGVGGLYLLGLLWLVWGLERATQHYESRRRQRRQESDVLEVEQAQVIQETSSDKPTFNPLDPAAWYYGHRSRKLNQSIVALLGYSFLFTLLMTLITQARGCNEAYELPGGGGGGNPGQQSAAMAQSVKIQKVVKKKFVINPFSSIVFSPPPIEDVQLELQELTDHTYNVGFGGMGQGGMGYGDGDGAGFGGPPGGKVRFIRLEYAGGDWDQDFGVGSDLNMLIEYGIRTKQKVNTETESRAILQLRNFPIGKAPPFVYMTGQRSISITESERKVLREYLLDKHGMIFCDNGGSRHFHNQFLELMNRVLEGKVEAVAVPLDDPIHSGPFKIPFLPYVAPHGGKEALGWKVDGRWVAYYSPGDIADAWSDGHAGVKNEIWEYCYQLGTNVIFYAHLEYRKWQIARNKK